MNALNTLNRLLDPVSECLTAKAAQRLVDLRADEATQELVSSLAERNTEGELTPEERSEYEMLVAANNIIAILQAKARSRLARRSKRK